MNQRLTLTIGEPEPEEPPAPEAGSLSPDPAGTSVQIVTFSGGSVDELGAALALCGSGVSAHATVAGGWVSYVPGAIIAAVNAGFNAAFADGVPAGQGLVVTNCAGN